MLCCVGMCLWSGIRVDREDKETLGRLCVHPHCYVGQAVLCASTPCLNASPHSPTNAQTINQPHRQSDDHGHLLTEQDHRLAEQTTLMSQLAGKVEGLDTLLTDTRGEQGQARETLTQVCVHACMCDGVLVGWVEEGGGVRC